MDEIPSLCRSEKVYFTVSGKNGGKRSRMACPEKESVSWMERFVNKFSRLCMRIVYLFSGTFATDKPCLEFLRQPQFVSSEFNADYGALSTETPIGTYERTVLNKCRTSQVLVKW